MLWSQANFKIRKAIILKVSLQTHSRSVFESTKHLGVVWLSLQAIEYRLAQLPRSTYTLPINVVVYDSCTGHL